MQPHTEAVAPIGVTHKLEFVDPPNVTSVPVTGYRDGYLQSRVVTQRTIIVSSAARYTPRSVFAVILLAGGVLFATPSCADSDTDWIRGAIHALQKAKHDRDGEDTKQVTPSVIPVQTHDRDPLGVISTLQSGGPTITSTNAFFQDIGSNGRTCFSCHQPQNGWGISASSVRYTFAGSGGKAPISWKNAFVDVIVGPPDCRVLITPKGSRSCVCTGITDGVTCLVSSASRSCFAFWSALSHLSWISLSAREGVANNTQPASSITANTEPRRLRAAADRGLFSA